MSRQKNTHRKIDCRSGPGGVQQSRVLPIRDFLAPGPPLIIQPNQGSDQLAYAQTVADQGDVNTVPLFLHGVPDNGNYELLDRSPGAIPQIIKTLSFGVFLLSSRKDWEYTFRPVLLIRKPGFVLDNPLLTFRDTEMLFLEK